MEEVKQPSQPTMQAVPFVTGSSPIGSASPVSKSTVTKQTIAVVTPSARNKPDNTPRMAPDQGFRPSPEQGNNYAPALANVLHRSCSGPPSHLPSGLPHAIQAHHREATNRLQIPFRDHHNIPDQRSLSSDSRFYPTEQSIAGSRFRRPQQNFREALMLEMIAYRREMETRIALARLSSLPRAPRKDLLHSAASFPRTFPLPSSPSSIPKNPTEINPQTPDLRERNRPYANELNSMSPFEPQDAEAQYPPAAQSLMSPPSTGRVYVDMVQSVDILCGRGGKSNHHVGNKKYRHVVAFMKQHYQHCHGKSQKTDLSRQIVDYCASYGARFLKKEADSDKYYVLTKDEARRKTSQALREPKTLKWTTT